MLLAQIWPFSNLSQQHPIRRNMVAKRTQYVAPNNVAICCVGMLRGEGEPRVSMAKMEHKGGAF